MMTTLPLQYKEVPAWIVSIVLRGRLPLPRRVIDGVAYYLLPAVLGITTLTGLGGDVQETIGEAAKILLLFILLLKPAATIFRPIGLLRTLLGYRRQIGIATFYLAFFHALPYIIAAEIGATTFLVSTAGDIGSGLWYGLIGLVGMTLLYLTSNALAQRKMGAWWKRTQRLAYGILPAVLIHAELMDGDGYGGAIILTAVFIGAKVIERVIRNYRAKKRQQNRTG